MEISRRKALQLAGATVIGAAAVETLGTGAAEAIPAKLGYLASTRLWGTKSVKQWDSVAGKFVYVRVPATRNLWKGTSDYSLNHGVGLWPDCARIGSAGHTIIYGHRTSHGGPFRKANLMKVGDQVVVNVTTGPAGTQGVFTYEMEGRNLENAKNHDAIWTYPAGLPGASGGCLTLICCSKSKFPYNPTDIRFRLCIRLKLVSSVVTN